MFASTTGQSKNKKAFMVKDRTIFDFVAMRDLTAIKAVMEEVMKNHSGVTEDEATAKLNKNKRETLHSFTTTLANGYPNLPALGNARDANGYTLLHIAAAHGYLDICKAFLGIPNADGNTIVGPDGRIVVSGAAIAANKRAQSPKRASSGGIRSAAADDDEPSGNAAAAADPLAASANRPRSRQKEAPAARNRLAGNTSLHPSQLPMPVQLPTFLKLDVNAVSECGYTPLHIAVMGGYEAIVKLFLEHGANVHIVTRGVTNEPLTAYQLARKHHHPRIERILEPLTLTEGNGCRKGIVSRDGALDAAREFVESVDPLKAAKEGNVLYFSLAVLDLMGAQSGGSDAVVNEEKYRYGMQLLDSIRHARCPQTGRNALMIALDRDDISSMPPEESPYHVKGEDDDAAVANSGPSTADAIPYCGNNFKLIIDLLTEPLIFVRRPAVKPENSYEAVFVAGPRYPSWSTFRLGYCYPIGVDGAPIRPKLVSEKIRKEREAAKKRRERLRAEAGDGEEDGEEEEGGGDGHRDEGGDEDNAHNTTAPHGEGHDDDGATVAANDREDEDEASLNAKNPTTGQICDSSSLPFSINAANNSFEGYTVLHYAVRYGHKAIARRLVESLGADATITTHSKQTAADLASSNGAAAAEEEEEAAMAGTARSTRPPPTALRPYLIEASLRKTFLDKYNRRDDIFPDERPDFAHRLRILKRKWRDADRVLKGTFAPRPGDVEEDDGDASTVGGGGADTSRNNAYRDDGTTAPSSPQRELADDESTATVTPTRGIE